MSAAPTFPTRPVAASRPSAPPNAWPPNAWPIVAVEALADRLTDAGWTLVEFWAPDNLFSRLLAPIRVNLPGSHGARLRLLCCTLGPADARAGVFGVAALPALVLFHDSRRIRRWIGAIDLSLLHRDIDFVLGGVACPDDAGP